jgi:aminoglycoside 6'-N-acetyltransferase I
MLIRPVTADISESAVALLARFFAEEGFSTPRPQIARHLQEMLADGSCWAALASEDDAPVGVVTVTTMRYVEWGLLGEIGDLYVLPAKRGCGIGSMLVALALDWCRGKGCAAVSVTITPEGEARHDLSGFYGRLDFTATGLTIFSKRL